MIFSVLVAGYPEPRVNFYREGKRLRPNERITIGEQHTVNFAHYIDRHRQGRCFIDPTKVADSESTKFTDWD